MQAFIEEKNESGIHLTNFNLSKSSAYSSLVIPAPTTVRRERGAALKSSAHAKEGGAFSSLSED